MAGTSRLSTRASADFPVPGVKLTQFQARVWEWIQKRSHLSQGICQAAKTLAEAFGCTRRYVEKAIKLFVDLGVLRHVRDYGLKTRRRYFVVGSPADPGPDAPLFCGPEFAESEPPSSHTDAPPLDPPIEVSGESEEEGCGGTGPPPPGIVEASVPGETQPPPKATPEQAAKLVEAAAKVFPTQAPRLVADLARKWAPDWIRAAIKRAVQKRERGGDVVPGYVIGCLNGFAADGGPPPELTAPELTEEESLRRFQELLDATPDTW